MTRKFSNDNFDLLDQRVRTFLQAVADMNMESFNRRYDDQDDEPVARIRWRGAPAYSSVGLIQALQGLLYNSDNSSDKRTEAKLIDLIYRLMSDYISSLPEYEQAGTWG